MSAGNRSHIDYAPQPGSQRRRRWGRSLTLATLVAAVVSAFWWGPPVGRQAALLRLQRRCWTYAQPPGHTAYDLDGARAAQFRSADARYVELESTSKATGFVFPEWQKLYSTISPPGMLPAATLFLHERRNSGGEA